MRKQHFDFQGLYKLPWTKNNNPNGWIEPTTHCQLACPGCYRGLAFPNPPRIHQDLNKLKKEIDTLIKIRRIKILSIAGGEPLLYPKLDELVTYAKSKSLQSRLVTNGAALTQKRLAELKKLGVSEVSIHIAAYQNRTNFKDERQINCLRQRFCEIFRKVKGVELNFIITVSKDNFLSLPYLIEFYQNNSDVINRILFTLYRDALFEINTKEDTSKYLPLEELISLISTSYRTKPCAYLPKTLDPKTPSWLFFVPILLKNKVLAYADAKTAQKINQSAKTNQWESFPAQTSLLQLVKSLPKISLATYGRIIAGYLKTVITSPQNLLAIPKTQIIILINTPRLTEYGWDLCDGCPDAILYQNKLVPSCLLERIKWGENISL